MNVVIVVILSVFIGTAQALKCYECKNGEIAETNLLGPVPYHQGCGKPFTAADAVKTKYSNMYCVKIVKGDIVKRMGAETCSPGLLSDDVEFYCCDADLCNGDIAGVKGTVTVSGTPGLTSGYLAVSGIALAIGKYLLQW